MRDRRVGYGEDLLDRLYETSLDPKGWAAFVRLLEDVLGSGVVALSIPAPSPETPGVVVAPSLDPVFVDSYGREAFRDDPWLREARGWVAGRLVIREGSVAGTHLGETSFYRDWMRPQGLRHDRLIGGVAHRQARGSCSLVTVFSRDEGRPGPAALRTLRELMPHLRRALAIHYQSERVQAARSALVTALDRLPLAVIVLDRHHHVQLMSRPADRLLGRRDGLLLERDGVHAARADEDLGLRRALGDLCHPSRRSASATLSFSRPSGGPPLRATLFPAPPREDAARGSQLTVMFVSDPDAEVELPAEALRRLYGLTSAESALVRELANGRSIQEAAGRLGITEGTARQRLALIFDKTGSGRQSALVRLVLTGPESLNVEP